MRCEWENRQAAEVSFRSFGNTHSPPHALLAVEDASGYTNGSTLRVLEGTFPLLSAYGLHFRPELESSRPQKSFLFQAALGHGTPFILAPLPQCPLSKASTQKNGGFRLMVKGKTTTRWKQDFSYGC